MKMKIFDRVLLAIILILMFLVALVVLAIGVRVLPQEIAQGVVAVLYTGTANAIILSVVAVIVILMVLRLAFRRRKPASKPATSTLIRTTDIGACYISMAAMNNMVQKHCRSNTRLRECFSSIMPVEGGVQIALRVTLMPDTEIPVLLDTLQKSLKEYIENCSGVNVRDIQIMVDSEPTLPKSRVD